MAVEPGTGMTGAGADALAAGDAVAVTGIGTVLPGCANRRDFWEQVSQGRSQLRISPRPDAPESMCAMGRVDVDLEAGLAALPLSKGTSARNYPRDVQIYLAAVAGALADAELLLNATGAERAGFFDGTSRSSFGHFTQRLTAGETAKLGRRDLAFATPGQAAGLASALWRQEGPSYTFAASCSSASVAIGHAYREIRDGLLDVAVAGGHDSTLNAPLYRMYAEAELLSPEAADPERAVQPYLASRGNAFGEGAVVLVLESEQRARHRGATVLGLIAGYAYANNGSHPTRVDATGERPAALMAGLLKDAAMDRAQVDFVVGHGNAVPQSDESELRYMRHVFGARSRQVPLISTKPIYGHTLGASGAVNAAAGLLMLHHQFVVPGVTVRAGPHDEQDVRACTGRAGALGAGVSMTFGLGGHNAGLLLRTGQETAQETALEGEAP